jgi:hypothetical protein
LVLILVTAMRPGAALAHGNVDQSIPGDPGCNTSNFPVSATANGGLQQTFVPTGTHLSSVAVCVSTPGASPVGVNAIVRDSNGTIIAGGSSLNPLAGFTPEQAPAGAPAGDYVHIDFLSPGGVTVTPGATYILEIAGGEDITWYGTNGTPSYYEYCFGSANAAGVVDFGFEARVFDTPVEHDCPAPVAPTDTPVPPTSTPVSESTEATRPTNTPAADVTTQAGSTPAAAQTTSATAGSPASGEQPAGVIAGSGAGPSPSTRASTGAAAGASASRSGLPRTGSGTRDTGSSMRIVTLLIAAAGALALMAGAALRQRTR